MKEFSTRLKRAREEKSMSQRSLGLALGLSDKTISSYESQRSFPNLEILKKIAEILEKPVEYFISSNREINIEDTLEKVIKKQESLNRDIKELISLIKKEV